MQCHKFFCNVTSAMLQQHFKNVMKNNIFNVTLILQQHFATFLQYCHLAMKHFRNLFILYGEDIGGEIIGKLDCSDFSRLP